MANISQKLTLKFACSPSSFGPRSWRSVSCQSPPETKATQKFREMYCEKLLETRNKRNLLVPSTAKARVSNDRVAFRVDRVVRSAYHVGSVFFHIRRRRWDLYFGRNDDRPYRPMCPLLGRVDGTGRENAHLPHREQRLLPVGDRMNGVGDSCLPAAAAAAFAPRPAGFF